MYFSSVHWGFSYTCQSPSCHCILINPTILCHIAMIMDSIIFSLSNQYVNKIIFLDPPNKRKIFFRDIIVWNVKRSKQIWLSFNLWTEQRERYFMEHDCKIFVSVIYDYSSTHFTKHSSWSEQLNCIWSGTVVDKRAVASHGGAPKHFGVMQLCWNSYRKNVLLWDTGSIIIMPL